jgi:hypothetical protein
MFKVLLEKEHFMEKINKCCIPRKKKKGAVSGRKETRGGGRKREVSETAYDLQILKYLPYGPFQKVCRSLSIPSPSY